MLARGAAVSMGEAVHFRSTRECMALPMFGARSLREARSSTMKGTEMTSTILCAIDEKTAPAVARTAADLARGLGSRVVLTHVADDPRPLDLHAQRERERSASIKRGLESLSGVREGLADSVETGLRVGLGSPVEQLLEAARDEQAELMVVGSRGRGALTSAVLGSVSRELARQAPCLVVIVTPRAIEHQRTWRDDYRSESSIVCGVEDSERSLRAARLAADLAGRLGDRLLVVHAREGVTELPPFAPEGGAAALPPAAQEALDSIDADAELVLEFGPPAYALESIATGRQARLIVVGARAIGDLRSAMLGSVSSQLVRLAGCPLVVLPEHAEIAPGSSNYELQAATA